MDNDIDVFNENRPPDTTWQVIKKFLVLIAICLVCVFCFYLSQFDNPFGFSPNVVDVSESIFGDITDHNFTIISQVDGKGSGDIPTIYYDGSITMGDEDPEQLVVLDRSVPDKARISAVIPITKEQIPYTYLGVDSSIYLFSYQELFFIDLKAKHPEVQKCQLEFPETIMDVAYFQGKVFAIDYMNTLYILDITDPAQPRVEYELEEEVLATNLISSDIFQVKDLDVYQQYLVMSDQSRIHFFDFSNYFEPREIGYYTLTTSFHFSYSEYVSVVGNRAFIYESYKHIDPIISYYLTIVDISNPKEPKRMVTYDYWPDSFTVYGSYESRVFVPDYEVLIDFSDKKNPQLIASINLYKEMPVNWYGIMGEDNYYYFLDGERLITLRYQQ